MSMPIAIVGMACRYPDADSPNALWENILAQRRAFRRIPSERLNLEDYYDVSGQDSDRTYCPWAAVLEGYEVDRVAFRISGETFRSVDMTHWLALDVASAALADAGMASGEGLPPETTGVLIGNTLTGEFSRANVMRLRWPYVRRVLAKAWLDAGWQADALERFLEEVEQRYKSSFAEMTSESLAGGLANTIAGRICNYYDLHGGGYAVDGACASSLLAVANACVQLERGDLDVAIAGGVDLSLDPFELVGFSRVGALATDRMRVYDRRSNGFWPGEGCGMLVLMREEDARNRDLPVYASIRGWGISSDGSGGITRPEVEGQVRALERAYASAGLGGEGVAYIEGHGTGTVVGDATELKAVSQVMAALGKDLWARRERTCIGSIKVNIGHTKAAAGVAGLIKAAIVVDRAFIPPCTGCEEPHELLSGREAVLRIDREGRPWEEKGPMNAGVSSMGFGGVNVHLVLSGDGSRAKGDGATKSMTVALTRSNQDAELFLFADEDWEGVKRQIEPVAGYAGRLSWAEMGDLAGTCYKRLRPGSWRAAVVASSPDELDAKLSRCVGAIERGTANWIDPEDSICLGTSTESPRVGLLFPGQASPTYLDGGAWGRRFPSIEAWYPGMSFDRKLDPRDTELAQPAIMASSLAGIKVLEGLHFEASVALGHSLGEIAALSWAGALDGDAAMRLVRRRGEMMARLGESGGAMAGIGADEETVKALIAGEGKTESVFIAAINGPAQVVVSGAEATVGPICERAESMGIRASRLPVSNAFHSPWMVPVEAAFRETLTAIQWASLEREVVSTITGERLGTDADLSELLASQLGCPVVFHQALQRIDPEVDLWLEVGPGSVLTGLVRDQVNTPVIALDVAGESLRGLLHGVAAGFALGAPVDPGVLFDGRFTRPFDLDWRPRFLANPCESAPEPISEGRRARRSDDGEHFSVSRSVPPALGQSKEPAHAGDTEVGESMSCAEVVYRLIARVTELPRDSISRESRLLGDLHLNSITVSQLVANAARQLGLHSPKERTRYADATVGQLIEGLEELAETKPSGPASEAEAFPKGVADWVRPFVVRWRREDLPKEGKEAAVRVAQGRNGEGRLLGPEQSRLVAALQEKMDALGVHAVCVCLPPEDWREGIRLLLEGARDALGSEGRQPFVVILEGNACAGAAFAKSFYLEHSEIPTCVIRVPSQMPEAAGWALAEVQRGWRGFREVKFDAWGQRWVPALEPVVLEESYRSPWLESTDVLVVTGGGKGIGAECALAWMKEAGARVALIGRSSPEESTELTTNIGRMRESGLTVGYYQADITDAEAVKRACASIESDLGPIRGILHSAGTNTPTPVERLDEAACQATLAPKLEGLENLLEAIDPAKLRVVVGFGSIIGQLGLQGEADYALANEWLSNRIAALQCAHRDCRCLSLEWSVWAGVGMGERLSSVASLEQSGVTPLTVDQGIAHFLAAIGAAPVTSMVVTGRFGFPPTVRLQPSTLPLRRFLEQPRVHYPGIELVVDAGLDRDRDPYLNDHVLGDYPLLPAVVGMEAMMQVAAALIPSDGSFVMEEIEFRSPVVILEGVRLRIRVAALRADEGSVRVVLRDEANDFLEDRFRAVIRMTEGPTADVRERVARRAPCPPGLAVAAEIDPARHLYGNLLFQTGRFQRIERYHALSATECWADLAVSPSDWFGRYLPQRLVLGDPGVRDAGIHAIQACLPHARLLPIGMDKLTVLDVRGAAASGEWIAMHAQERARDGSEFTYDVDFYTKDGQPLERWEGLVLKEVGKIEGAAIGTVALLRPYLERRLPELISGARAEVVVRPLGADSRETARDLALQEIWGRPVTLRHRPDGKPELEGGVSVSVGYTKQLVFVAVSPEPIGCDIEEVMERSEVEWETILGEEALQLARRANRKANEPLDVTATRVWTAREALVKRGLPAEATMTVSEVFEDGWLLFQASGMMIATLHTALPPMESSVVMSLCINRLESACTTTP